MIKPVMGNSIVKKTVLGAMMAGAVMAGGAVTKNNNSNANIQRTEISKEAAEASKTLAVTNVMSPQQVGPVRYKALDKKVIARAENAQEVTNNTKFVNDTYNTYGTFAATALLQFVLDNDVLERTTKDFQKTIDKKYAEMADMAEKIEDMDADTRLLLVGLGDDTALLSKTGVEKLGAEVKKGAEQVLAALDSNNGDLYAKRLTNIILASANGVKPTYEQVSKAIDDTFNSLYSRNPELKKEYNDKVNSYITKLGSNKTTENKAKILAYKFYVMDSIIMENVNKNVGLSKDKDYMKMYNTNFVQGCKPE